MKNFSTWLLVMFMVMFWVFRVVVTLAAELGIDLAGFTPINKEMEIILLFVALLCMILVVKRKIIGSLLYLVIYGAYFGEHLVANLIQFFQGQATLTMDLSMNLLSDAVAIILALFSVMDMLVDRGRKVNPVDK